MKYLSKISSIVVMAALVVGLSFSASMAQSNYNKKESSQKNTLKGKVVNSQSSEAVANAKVIVTKGNQATKGRMQNDTTNTQMNNQQSPFTTTTDQNGSFS